MREYVIYDTSKFKKLDIVDDSAKTSLIISKQGRVKYYVNTYLTDENGFSNKIRSSLTPTLTNFFVS